MEKKGYPKKKCEECGKMCRKLWMYKSYYYCFNCYQKKTKKDYDLKIKEYKEQENERWNISVQFAEKVLKEKRLKE